MRKKAAYWKRGEVATLLTIAAMVVVGLSVFVSSLVTNKSQKTTATQATGVVCNDTPNIGPPDTAPNPHATYSTQGYFWEADCNNTKGFLKDNILQGRQ